MRGAYLLFPIYLHGEFLKHLGTGTIFLNRKFLSLFKVVLVIFFYLFPEETQGYLVPSSIYS
jgi:hypothetical protein